MSERYTRLFALEENLYSEGSPVVISAGALLKDNQTGAVLAQLKIKNISRRVIKAAIVRLTAFDAFGKPVDGAVEKEYLDLVIERDGEFGQKVLIPLPNAAARSFVAVVTCVGFADNTVWNYAGANQDALPRPKLLTKALGESELVKQYRMKYGTKAQVLPEEYKDIWFCACGALCHADEGFCRVCGNKKAELLPFDQKALTAEKDERLKAEAAARKKAEEEAEATRKKTAEEAAAAAEKKAERAKAAAKKAKKTAAIVIPVACVCTAFALLLTQVILPIQKLNKAMDMIDAGEYDAGYTLLEEIGNNKVIAASKYDRAMDRITAQDYETALTLLDGLNYKDSETQRINAICLSYKDGLNRAAAGDTVLFGSYEQDNYISNGKEAIEWLVLAKEENRMLVISQYTLDCRQYNTSYTSVTWESCTLRKWLNEDFFNAAFSDEEKNRILAATVSADKNPDYKTDPGNATQDKVFLLSIAEANEYFKNDESRMCVPTAYAKANGAYTNSSYVKGDAAACWWWLRSPGDRQNCASYILYGNIDCDGRDVSSILGCVRPAMWIDLEA